VRNPDAIQSEASAPVARFALPVCGIGVTLHEPTGLEDLLLAEHRVNDPALVLALIERIAFFDVAIDAATLAVADVDALIARLRQALLGDRISADMRCPGATCAMRVDLSFSLDAYLHHHTPKLDDARRKGRGWSVAEAADAPGWYLLAQSGAADVRFRLPTLGDQIAIYGHADSATLLAERCIEGHPLAARAARRVDAAMEALAPALAGPLEGRCPECGTALSARFEARLYCLEELRHRALFIYDDVDALAQRYHWSERTILELPNERRAIYVERARPARSAAGLSGGVGAGLGAGVGA
jgi:hypothetical protein